MLEAFHRYNPNSDSMKSSSNKANHSESNRQPIQSKTTPSFLTTTQNMHTKKPSESLFSDDVRLIDPLACYPSIHSRLTTLNLDRTGITEEMEPLLHAFYYYTSGTVSLSLKQNILPFRLSNQLADLSQKHIAAHKRQILLDSVDKMMLF